jgi:hypothetical protein
VLERFLILVPIVAKTTLPNLCYCNAVAKIAVRCRDSCAGYLQTVKDIPGNVAGESV